MLVYLTYHLCHSIIILNQKLLSKSKIMTKEMILDLILQGEVIKNEFKECKNEVASDVYPTVCSFSNRLGGHIIMGVADNC